MSLGHKLIESLKSTDTKYVAEFCTEFWNCFICKCSLVSRSKLPFLNVANGLGLHQLVCTPANHEGWRFSVNDFFYKNRILEDLN